MEFKLEICAGSIQSALNAEAGGADRIELCDNLAEGGTTPSYGTVKTLLQILKIPILPIIRPRGGDFNYSAPEFESMKSDVEIFKKLGCHGVVFGILCADGSLDVGRCTELAELAGDMEMGFHRAFDDCTNQQTALEEIIKLGFSRILTSGGADKANNGTAVISRLKQAAGGRITVMPGSGINSGNIQQIFEKTACNEFHGTAKAEDGVTKVAEVINLREQLKFLKEP